MNKTEEWRSILKYSGLYWVSDRGRVQNSHKILKQEIRRDGSRLVTLCGSTGRHRNHRIHRLVWEAFRGPLLKNQSVSLDDGPMQNYLDRLSMYDGHHNKTYKNNKLGARGVSQISSGQYRARIWIDKKVIELGYFTQIEDAIAARKKAETCYKQAQH